MKTEPTVVIEIIRFAAIVAAMFGVVISEEEQAGIVAAIGAVLAAVSIGLAIWNRRKVYAKASVERIADAATYLAPGASTTALVGEPPKGNIVG